MKLLIFTQYYPPEMGAPQARLSELAERLNALGHEIHVLTAFPNYPKGKIFEGYNGFSKKEYINNIQVHRVWISPSKSKSLIKRLLSYFSFVVTSSIYGIFNLKKYDFIFVESPPLFITFAVLFINLKCRSKIIFNVSDLWPDSALDMGLVSKNWKYYIMKGLERFSYKNSYFISAQAPSIVNEIKKTTKNNKPVVLLSNGVDINKFNPLRKDMGLKSKFNLDGYFVFVYAGLLGMAQGLHQIIEIAKKFDKENIKTVKFLIVGDGPVKDDLINQVNNLDLDNVVFSEPIERDKVPVLLASMDAAIIPLLTAIKGAVPSKIYEAMASGLPILFIGEGDARHILREGQVGFCSKPGDIDDAFFKAKTLYENEDIRNKFRNNELEIVQEFSREIIVANFNIYLNKIKEEKNG